MIQFLRAFWGTFFMVLGRQIMPNAPPPTEGTGAWGDLIDPPMPCGKCEIEDDECACLLSLYRRYANVEGYNVDQLYHDIEDLENGKP